MATLSGRESSKVAMPAGSGESEGIVGCRCVGDCSASRETLLLVNFADAFRSMVPSRVGDVGVVV